ncbi:MAG: hypothetical protein Q7S16_05705 [bacterium]|nr:hypothetical protein [bacterium]
MKKFFQRRGILFWGVIIFIFLLALHFSGALFWENAYDHFLQSLGWPGKTYLIVMSLFSILVLIASPFLLLFSPLFVWLIIKKKRAIRKGANADAFDFIPWLILVIGVISVLIVSYLASGFLSPW